MILILPFPAPSRPSLSSLHSIFAPANPSHFASRHQPLQPSLQPFALGVAAGMAKQGLGCADDFAGSIKSLQLEQHVVAVPVLVGAIHCRRGRASCAVLQAVRCHPLETVPTVWCSWQHGCPKRMPTATSRMAHAMAERRKPMPICNLPHRRACRAATANYGWPRRNSHWGKVVADRQADLGLAA